MSNRRLRVAFFIQGEGRGHMTQALALRRILEAEGHQVVAGFMGENPHRPVPEFFRARFEAPLHTYLAPAFVLDDRARGVRPWASLLQTASRVPHFWAHAPDVDRAVRACRPDLLVNFYDLLCGLYTSLYRPPVPVVSVGHQFLFLHPDFPTPEGEAVQVLGIRLNTRATSSGATLRLALSFTPLRDVPGSRVRVVPPLLRDIVLRSESAFGEHLLAYVLYPGYGEDIMEWHRSNPRTDLHCFWDRRDADRVYSPWKGLTFHRLDESSFLRLLSTSRGFASTAGFESVCEAAYLGKPILLVPTENHVEQLCNAMDAERAGLAHWRKDFDLTEFVAGLGEWDLGPRDSFRRWVEAAPEVFLRLLEGVARGEDPMRIPIPAEEWGTVAPAPPEGEDVRPNANGPGIRSPLLYRGLPGRPTP